MSVDILILNYLKQGHSLTQFEAVELFSCYRLSAVIHRLRGAGYQIKSHRQPNTNGHGSFSRYELDYVGEQNA